MNLWIFTSVALAVTGMLGKSLPVIELTLFFFFLGGGDDWVNFLRHLIIILTKPQLFPTFCWASSVRYSSPLNLVSLNESIKFNGGDGGWFFVFLIVATQLSSH